MATTANQYAPLGAVFILRVVDSFITVKKAIVRWNEKRLTRAELSALTNAQLEDIGLTRYDIDHV